MVCSDDGEALSQRLVQGLVLRAARYANVQNVGVHVLRHTFCSHLAMKGGAARAIQELAGHQDLTTIQRYMHLSPRAVESTSGGEAETLTVRVKSRVVAQFLPGPGPPPGVLQALNTSRRSFESLTAFVSA